MSSIETQRTMLEIVVCFWKTMDPITTSLPFFFNQHLQLLEFWWICNCCLGKYDGYCSLRALQEVFYHLLNNILYITNRSRWFGSSSFLYQTDGHLGFDSEILKGRHSDGSLLHSTSTSGSKCPIETEIQMNLQFLRRLGPNLLACRTSLPRFLRHNPKIGENQKWKFSFFRRK